ncbi:MAG: hypothetical protein ABI605_15485 [Rhizobacter sp.]
MKNILFIGNSHLIALIDAAQRCAGTQSTGMDIHDAFRGIGFRRYDFNMGAAPEGPGARMRFILAGAAAPSLFQMNAEGGYTLAPGFVDELREGAAQFGGRVDQVVSYFHGNEHSTFSIVEHEVPFDFFADADDQDCIPDAPPRQVIPAEVIRRELKARARPTAIYCQTLKSLFPGQEVVHVLPPPPIADERQLRRSPEIFAQLFHVYGIAPPALRRKTYKLYAQMLGDELRATGVRVVEAPAGSHVDGYLHEDWAVGSTHADHRYGQLVLQELGAV